jgi:hypothetical protein
MLAAHAAFMAGGPTTPPQFVSVGAQYEATPWPGPGGAGAAWTLYYNVTAALNNVLFTSVFCQGGSPQSATVTYAGQAMTLIASNPAGGQFFGVYMLRNPSVGNNALSITTSGSYGGYNTIDTASILYKDVGIVGTPTVYTTFPDPAVAAPVATVPALGKVVIFGLGQYLYSMLTGTATMRQASFGTYPSNNIAEVSVSGSPTWNSLQRPGGGLYAMVPLNPS